jgi:hypothetical protein
MPRYPSVSLTTESQVVKHGAVDVEALSPQLVRIRDAFLELFEGAPARSKGELHRLDVGLAVTEAGEIAFATGNTRPSLTLSLERRQRSPSTRSASAARSVPAKEPVKEPEVVEID